MAESFRVPASEVDGINIRFPSVSPTDLALGDRMPAYLVPFIGRVATEYSAEGATTAIPIAQPRDLNLYGLYHVQLMNRRDWVKTVEFPLLAGNAKQLSMGQETAHAFGSVRRRNRSGV